MKARILHETISVFTSCALFVIFYVLNFGIFLQIIAWYLLLLAVPSIIIKVIAIRLNVAEHNCEGLKGAGQYIVYIERSLIFSTFLLTYFSSSENYLVLLGALSLIIAGKGFRFSSTSERPCAEWYILGTFLSITLAVFLSWLLFFILLG